MEEGVGVDSEVETGADGAEDEVSRLSMGRYAGEQVEQKQIGMRASAGSCEPCLLKGSVSIFQGIWRLGSKSGKASCRIRNYGSTWKL